MISDTTTSIRYVVTDGVLSYGIPFRIYAPTDVAVFWSIDARADTKLAIDEHYTVTTMTDGGTVNLLPGVVPVGAVLAVFSNIPATQEADFSSTSAVNTEALETQLDRQVQMIQQLEDQVSRAVILPATSSETPQDVVRAVYAARDDAQTANSETQAAKVAAAASADAAGENAVRAAQKAADAEYWAGRAEEASNNGPATPDRLGNVKPRKGLSIMEDGTLDLNTGDGLEIDATENAPRVNASGIRHGILAVEHGGTGSDAPQGALKNLGLADWQDSIESTNPQRLRNVILSGREKDGYPAYLVGHEFLDMQHEDGVYISARGTVSSSGEYSADYKATKPLRNQVVYQSNGWLTPNTVTSGQWEYTFADRAHVLSGMYLNNRDNTPAYWPKKWQLQGWNEETSAWEDIYRRDNDQPLRGSADNLKDNGRMYWFTENIKAYQRIRINIESNHGGNYTQLSVIRLYEAVIPGQHKYDVALYASEKQPFTASIACGLAADGARTVDRVVKLTEPVTFDGRKLAEMSRNYIYIVPADAGTGRLPDNLDADRAVPLPGNAAFLYADTRKLHYGTQADIEKECFALLQSRHTVAYDPVPNGKFEMNQGAWNHPLHFQNVRVDLTEKPRGAESSYKFVGVGGGNFISPNTNLTDVLLGKNAHPYHNECTIEIDFKWNGPSPETADGYHIIYDNGFYTNRGWAAAYHNRKKCIAVHWGSRSINNWCYHVPFNAADARWHTIAITLRDSNLFIHVDGKCLGAFNNVSLCNPNYRYWMVGRWIHTDANNWYGHINNLRITLGTALYQGQDYVVVPVFNRGHIPDKTLWYDAAEGVVKEWQADAGAWLKTPMLPVGHVDTGRREHLMTDQPRGTHHTQATKWVQRYAADGNYDGNSVPASMFNLGHGGNYPFGTLNTNNVAHYVEFEVESPMSFSGMVQYVDFWGHWYSRMRLFTLSGRNADTEDWTVLIDRSSFVDDGELLGTGIYTASNGSSPYLGGYRLFAISDTKPYRQYRLDILPKNNLPFYKDSGYSTALLTFVFRDAKPEVLGISSYALGDVWSVGPIPLGLSVEAEIPVPFGNMAFEASGFVEEEMDFQVKRRRLGEVSGWYSGDKHSVHGEIVYQKNDALIIVSGKSSTAIYSGSHYNSPTVNSSSAKANYYITARKRY